MRSLPLLLTLAAVALACGARTGAIDQGVAPGAVSDGGVLDDAVSVSSDAATSDVGALDAGGYGQNCVDPVPIAECASSPMAQCQADELGLACGPPVSGGTRPLLPDGCYRVGATLYGLQYYCCPCGM